MRVYSVPAAYQRHVEASLAIAVAEVGSDVAFRADEDPRVQALAPVPAFLFDGTPAEGRTVVVVLTEAEAIALNIDSVPDTLRRTAFPAQGKVAASNLLFPEGLD